MFLLQGPYSGDFFKICTATQLQKLDTKKAESFLLCFFFV
jgi:hypothetical protein